MKNSAEKQKEFMSLYEPVHERFVKFCKAKCYGFYEPEDLVNETVLVAYEKFESIKKKESFMYFLFGTASRILSNHNRRRKFWGAFDEVVLGRQESTEVNAEKSLDIQLLYKYMNQLPEKQKESLILHDINGFSLKEVADIQKSSLSAVKVRVMRGRRKLGSMMEEKPSGSIMKKISTVTGIFL